MPPLSGKGIIRRSAAMQEFNSPASQAAANAFALKNDVVFQMDTSFLAGAAIASPNTEFGPYNKGIMWTGNTSGNNLPTDFPEEWYTHDAVPFAKANRVNSKQGTSIWVMNPVSTASWTDTSGAAGPAGTVYKGWPDFHKHWLVKNIKSHVEYSVTFADTLSDFSLNGQLDPTTHNLETSTTWYAKLKTDYQTIMLPYINGQGFLVYGNNLITNPSLYTFVNGAMLEDFLRTPTTGSLASMSSTTLHTKFTGHGQKLLDAQLSGKPAFPQAQILASTGITFGSAAETAWTDMMAACSYIFDIGHWYIDWNILQNSALDPGASFAQNLKTPMDASPPTQVADFFLKAGTSGSLYGRRYVRGFALVNTSSAAISYTLPRADYKKIDGTTQATSISVPARSGVVLYANVDDPASVSSNPGWPKTGVMFGSYVDLTKPANGESQTEIQTREASFGRMYALDTHFYGTGAPSDGFPEWDLQNKRTPLITTAFSWGLSPFPGYAVAQDGSQDTMYHNWATYLKNVPGVVIVRLFQEMNGNWFNFGTGASGYTTGFANMWRYIWNLWKADGVDFGGKVMLCWNPNTEANLGISAATTDAAYPGDQYVDCIGVDLYNKDTGGGGGGASFQTAFSAIYGRYAATGKPFIVPEFGCVDHILDQRKNYFAAMRTYINGGSVPLLKGIAYWDGVGTSNDPITGQLLEYRTDQTASGNAASATDSFNQWKAIAADANFQAVMGSAVVGPPPPPPPPPDPTTFFDMDFGVNTGTTTPFGFDSIPNGVGAGGVLEVVSGTGTVGATNPSGAGVRGSSVSSAPYTAEKTAGVTKPGYMSVQVKWYKLQPGSWDQHDLTAFAGLDTMIDFAAAEKLAGRPVSIGLRIMAGADAPVGGRDVDGTTIPSWMTGGGDVNNNNKATDFMIWASNDGGSRLSHVPIYWNPDFSYNDAYLYHYNNLMVWLNGYLNSTTSGGNRRADYILHVPVAAPTEVGSEMPIGMGSGGASFDPPVVIAGTTYGNGSNGAPAITDIGSVNRASSKLHMPATVAADTQSAQNTWLANWYHNMSTATLGGSIAPGDGAWMRAINIHMAQANFKSSIAYGFIFADNGVRGLDILPRCTQWLKTKLWTGKTDGRVWPPNGDFSQPISTWTYRNWSAAAADVLDLALSLVAPAYPLMWIQTANAVGYGGSRGMPPSDFIQTATDFMNTYKVQFFETYATVWTDPTYGAANVSFTNSTLIPTLAANAQAQSSGGGARGELHVKEVSTLATGPVGRRLIPAGNKDVWYRFVLDDFTVPSAIVTLLFSSPSLGSNNGDLSVRLNTSKQLVVRWNSSSAADFTDTVAVVKGDLIEVRHYLDPAGTACGYELWVNNTLRHKNLALAAPANSTVSFVNIGLPNAVNAEAWVYRFGAANTRMGSPIDVTVPTNSDDPVVNITNPGNGTVYTANTTLTISATATDNDGISLVEMQLDGGSWQPMTLQGSQYVATATLTGTAGTAKAHTIAVRATDAYTGTQRQGSASVTVTVNIPGADVIPPNINVTNPATQASTVANGVTTQVVAGTVTDAVGVTLFQINGVDVVRGTGGSFSTTLPLIVGTNVFTLLAKDAAGNTSTVTYTVTRQDSPINIAPDLVVTAPVDGQVFPVGTKNVTLSGTAADTDGTISSVAYTYDGSTAVPMALSAGAFSKSIPVTEGAHTITVTATDNQGLTASATMNIIITSSTVVDTSQGTGFNISLDFGKGQVLVRV